VIFLVVLIHFFFAFAFFILQRVIEASFFFLVGACLLILLFPTGVKVVSQDTADDEVIEKATKLQKTVQIVQKFIESHIFFVFGSILYGFIYGMLLLAQPNQYFSFFLWILFFISISLF